MVKVTSRKYRSGKTVYTVTDGAGPTRIRETVGSDKTLAEARAAQIRLEKIHGKLGIKTKKIPLGEALNDYLTSCQANLKPRSFTRYRQHCQTFWSWTKDNYPLGLSIDDVTPRIVDKYKNYRRVQGRAAKTVKVELENISSFLNWCVRMGLTAKNPIRGNIQYPKISKTLPRIYTPEELKLIFDNAGDLRPFLEISYRSGFRLEEVLSLKKKDFVPNKKLVLYRNNKGNEEWYPCSARLAAVLKKLCRGKKPDDFLFSYPGHGNARQTKVRLAFQKILRSLDIPHGTLHNLKHSYVTHLLDAGVNIRTVQRLAHHENIETTMRYSRPATQDQMRDGVELLPI